MFSTCLTCSSGLVATLWSALRRPAMLLQLYRLHETCVQVAHSCQGLLDCFASSRGRINLAERTCHRASKSEFAVSHCVLKRLSFRCAHHRKLFRAGVTPKRRRMSPVKPRLRRKLEDLIIAADHVHFFSRTRRSSLMLQSSTSVQRCYLQEIHDQLFSEGEEMGDL